MLKITRPQRADQGSSLVTVVVVMLILAVVALSIVAVVGQTTRSLVNTRSTTQARAAADAGIAAALAAFMRAEGCPGAPPASTTPRYTTTCSDPDSGSVTLTATGRDAAGNHPQTVEAVYQYRSDAGGSGDMVFFGDTTFSHEVLTYALDNSLLSIIIPTGDFTCMAPVPANIMLGGDFETKGGCTVDGGVVAGGKIAMNVAGDTVHGNITSSGTAENTLQGTVGGSLTARGGISFGWNGKHVGAGVQSSGNVKLGNTTIDGSLTLPSSATLTLNSGTVRGGINRPATVTPPVTPQFQVWYDYAYRFARWQAVYGFANQIVLTATGSGPGTCAYYNSWPSTGWFALADLTQPTVIDARACPQLSANAGMQPTVALRTDIAFVAGSFDLTRLTLTSSGGKHKVWWVVEDKVDNDTPSCSGGAGNIVINNTVMSRDLVAMAYTPCVVDVHGTSQWTGSFYGGSFNYGGGMSFHGDPILLPDQPGGSASGGGEVSYRAPRLVSQRDVLR